MSYIRDERRQRTLGKAEDVVDEEQHILTLFVTEVLEKLGQRMS